MVGSNNPNNAAIIPTTVSNSTSENAFRDARNPERDGMQGFDIQVFV
jgi:hypothetical protein